MVEIEMDRARVAWWGFGLVIAAAVAFVVYAFIGTFVFGLFVYYATRPIYRQIRRVMPSPSIAAALSLLAITLPAFVLLMYAVAIAIQDARGLLDQVDAGPIEDAIAPYIETTSAIQTPGDLLAAGRMEVVQQALQTLLEYLGFVGTGLLHVFIMFVIAFYLLRDDQYLGEWLQGRFGDEAGGFAAYLAAVDRDLHNVFFGNLLNVLLTGAIGAVTYSVLNLYAPTGLSIPHAALVGLLAGVASLVPVVGMKLVYVPVTGYLLARGYVADASGILWFPIAFFVVSFIVVDVIPDLMLRPYVSGRRLHTGQVMLAYLFGPILFGWYGIFLAPVLLVVVRHFVDLILPDLMAGEPVSATSVDPAIRSGATPLLGRYDHVLNEPGASGDTGETEGGEVS